MHAPTPSGRPALRRFAAATAAALAAAALAVVPQAQVAHPGQNINMVTVDPWLQKQNEPSIAVFPSNPCILIAGANDYRTVNIPGLPEDREIGDAWVGLYISIDCGQTWFAGLIPGFPQDSSAEGMASPAKGFTTAADPTVRTGQSRMAYYSFIVFNRGTNDGRLLVARFLNKNNKEGAAVPIPSPVTYLDTKVWDNGSSGRFLDKPYLFVSRGAGTCSVGGLTIPADVVHLVWTVFVSNSDNVVRTKVYYARSSNCGASLDGPAVKLSEGYPVGQGGTIAVDPRNGTTYVAWRQFRTDKDPTADQILFTKSLDGKSFPKAVAVAPLSGFSFFDQPTTAGTFRTNAFPTMAVDHTGRLHLLVAVRGPLARIVHLSSADGGTTWTGPTPIDDPTNSVGHQVMPALSYSAGRLHAIWYDQRDDVSGVNTTPFINEADVLWSKKRHTLDVRGAEGIVQADGSVVWVPYGILQLATPAATAPRISRYLLGGFAAGGLQQLQFHRPNLRLYAGGTRPFIGDYIDVGGPPFVAVQAPDGSQRWVPNMPGEAGVGAAGAALDGVFHAVWTDNRDAKVGTDLHAGSPDPPPLAYTAPGLPGCVPGQEKSRNANVYTARITPGLFVSVPGNQKPSVTDAGTPIQRSFAVFVQNTTAFDRRFRLTIANQPPDLGGRASFTQFGPLLTQTEVDVLAGSSATRSVHVTSTVAFPLIRVDVLEVTSPDPDPGVPPLTGSTTINPDFQNPDLENPDLENQELHNPDLENPDLENPDMENPDLENPDLENPDLENPDMENPDLENPDLENPDLENPDLENPDLENPDLENGAVTDYSVDVVNEGNTTSGQQVAVQVDGDTSGHFFQLIATRIYTYPTAKDCQPAKAAQNQVVINIPRPDLSGTFFDPNDPSGKNATIILAPGERLRLTLRAIDKDVMPGPIAGKDGTKTTPFCPILGDLCTTVTHTVTFRARAQAANTGETAPREAEEPLSLVVTNTDDAGAGSLRQAILTANARAGLDTIRFAIPGEGPHTIAPVSPLPAISDPVVIDAVPGGACDGSPPSIRIDGARAGESAHGLFVTAGGSIVRGLSITGFAGAGVLLSGGGGSAVECSYLGLLPDGTTVAPNGLGVSISSSPNNRIGGPSPLLRNVISGNAGVGVLIQGAASTGNLVAGNYIGTDDAGEGDRGNGSNGVHIVDAPSNTIGGATDAHRNVISGNDGEGVRLDGALATNNVVRRNFVGLDATGTFDLGNQFSGIYVRRAPANTVLENTVSGNDGFAGIAICGNPGFCGGGDIGTQGNAAAGNVVRTNRVGTDAAGTAALGNAGFGVSIDGASNTVVGGIEAGQLNAIAHNGSDGVVIFNPPATGNRIRGNSIHSNGGLGIDLHNDGVTPNDVPEAGPPDTDDGANGLQNFPVLTSAVTGSGSTTISGSLSSTPNTTFTIDFYASAACDASGHGEGATHIGSQTVTTDGSGQATIDVTLGVGLTPGTAVTATATDAAGNTSEFSACRTATAPVIP
ncbi:MAG TPA: hypothetical protein VNK92_05960 [Vicinamibacterales bacterium]|nr:hypothetical protein [Vicinamibacterales bacterium]